MKIVYIIVPVYNVEKYLAKCLDSLLLQTYKNIIILCVNDGSTDKSQEILTAYSLHYKNIIILNKPNGGLSSARNYALDYIEDYSNSYIAFVDSDDYVSRDYINTMVNLSEKYDSEIVITSYYNIHEGFENKDFVDPVEITEKTLLAKDALLDMLKGKIKCHAHCKLFKAYLWSETRFNENVSFMEDQYLMPTIISKTNLIITSNYRGYYYLHRLGSLCQSKMTFRKINDALTAYIYLYNYIFDFGKKYSKKIKKMCLNQLAEIYFMMYPRVKTINLDGDEKTRWDEISFFIHRHHVILFYKPRNKKTFMKKCVFLISKKMYLKLYNKHLKTYDL